MAKVLKPFKVLKWKVGLCSCFVLIVILHSSCTDQISWGILAPLSCDGHIWMDMEELEAPTQPFSLCLSQAAQVGPGHFPGVGELTAG